MSRMLLANRGYNEAWRLQYLTNLNELPDYEQGWYRGSGTQGAPVDADGNPVYHHLPKSWQAAQSDGERWRWALSQAAENNPQMLNAVREELAEFSAEPVRRADDGVLRRRSSAAWRMTKRRKTNRARGRCTRWPTTKRSPGWPAASSDSSCRTNSTSFASISRLPTSRKRGMARFALEQLAQIYENRRQYPQAAEYWRRSIKEYGPGHDDFKKQRLDQIVGNWGRFEPVVTQPAGKGATVDFRFRNGKKVTFEAHEIKVAKLLDDVKHISSRIRINSTGRS